MCVNLKKFAVHFREIHGIKQNKPSIYKHKEKSERSNDLQVWKAYVSVLKAMAKMELIDKPRSHSSLCLQGRRYTIMRCIDFWDRICC